MRLALFAIALSGLLAGIWLSISPAPGERSASEVEVFQVVPSEASPSAGAQLAGAPWTEIQLGARR